MFQNIYNDPLFSNTKVLFTNIVQNIEVKNARYLVTCYLIIIQSVNIE